MIKTSEALTTLIDRYNKNPMNLKKIYFTYLEDDSDVLHPNSISIMVEIGTTKLNSSIFKQYGNSEEIEYLRERLFEWVLEWLFSNIYDRMHEGNFVNYRSDLYH